MVYRVNAVAVQHTRPTPVINVSLFYSWTICYAYSD